MEDWEKIVEIFEQAVELAPAERARFLARQCPDRSIRAEVEAMLAADVKAQEFIETPALPFGETLLFESVSTPHDDGSPGVDKIGGYRILREIGRGGMGTVYAAERENTDFAQKVAVKLIKRGMDTELVVRRFRHERQILARLNHPNIARLFDGGTTGSGLPFFVMEYVAGEELLVYCERKNLGINERLAIFRKICAAVSYAHQNLIVHRDLKPSNILITKDGEPKLLDFGISKILSDEEDAATGTATALGMLTPKYASPEQFRGETVTTATDVYSLGVILYELLTGSLPYDFKNGRAAYEIAKIISETDPLRPSSAVSGRWSAAGKKTRNNRQRTTNNEQPANPKSQIPNPKSLRGDLDNIILKALKKEAAQRYASVDQFSEDLRRHQEGLPVSARPDTPFYRASKFVRRNRTAVTAVVLIFLTLLGGIGATLWQERRAVRRYEIARELANNVLFKYTDEIGKLPGSTRVREMMVKDALNYLNRLQADTSDAELQREIALAYYKIGNIQDSLYDNSADNAANALVSYANALKIQEKLLAETPDDLKLRRQTGDTYNRQGQSFAAKLDYQNALLSYESARRNFKFGIDKKPDDLQFLLSYIFISRSIDNMLDTSAEQKLESARRLMSLAEGGKQIAPDDANLKMMIALIGGDIASHLGLPDSSPLNRTDEAVRQMNAAAEILQHLIKTAPAGQNFYREIYASLMMIGADIEIERGNLEAALEKNREAIAITESKTVAEPENTNAKIIYAFALNHHARSLTAGRRFEEAEQVFRRAQQLFDENKNLMETIPALVTLSINLNEDEGDLLTKQSKFAAALDLYRKSHAAAEIYSRKMADHRPSESRGAARLLLKIGLAQSKIAENAKPDERRKLTDEAAQNLKQGLESYQSLAGKNLLSLKDLRVYEAASKEITQLK
jgi:eukaryotic-like serine/threonine-protein kinase